MFTVSKRLSEEEKGMFFQERQLRKVLETGGLSYNDREIIYKEIEKYATAYKNMRKAELEIFRMENFSNENKADFMSAYLLCLTDNGFIDREEAFMRLQDFRELLYNI